MDSPPLPPPIAYSNDDNNYNVSWAVYDISFTNAMTKRKFINK